ncbi:MAG: SMC-Scp complex subunit ScpB [Candidatus Aenigmarchaeota archaeon]|nr:SMC-Scp complex subunit ScpB [Candidatus Aenigmarchaeota archaeon]
MSGQSDNHKGLLEAALFMSAEPLTVEGLGKIAGVNSLGYVKGMLLELRDEYQHRGIHLAETPQGWSFHADHAHIEKVAGLTPYADITEGQKRTLAIVAYKEPVQQSDVIRIQGNKSYAYIKTLMSKGLIRAERQGRSKMLSLTTEFERYFGGEKEKIREDLIRKMNSKLDQKNYEGDSESGKLNMSSEDNNC